MSHDSRYGSNQRGGPHDRRNRRHDRYGSNGGGPRRENKPASGGFWGFIKKLLGMGGGSSRPSHAPSADHRQRNGRGDAPRNPRARSIPPMEVLTPRLYVGNLSYDASESDIFDHLSKVAGVKNVEVVRDSGSNSKGFGFAEMLTLEGAQEVAKKLHDTDFMGRLLIVNGAKSQGERTGGGPRNHDRADSRPPHGEQAERSSEFDYERGPRNPSYD